MLLIKRTVLEAIIAQAREELPYEACGYLAEKNGIVESAIALANIDKAADHFSMDPAEQFAAIKKMRGQGQRLCGVYHSHPETPARPSLEDIRLAYDPEISYVIISLADPERVEVKSFKISQGQVLAEEIQPIEEPSLVSDWEPEKETTMPSVIKVDAVKDCRTVGCPMNLVYAKVELAKLQSGQILEILLDDGPPINNVPGSVTREGHRIIEQKRLADGSWSLVIEKK